MKNKQIKILPQVILIDDNFIDNALSKILLNEINPDLQIETFFCSERGLEYIASSNPDVKDKRKTVVLLDIHMPKLNGFQFIDVFSNLEECIKNMFEIYVLSSTINREEIENIKGKEDCKGFLKKPISVECLAEIVNY